MLRITSRNACSTEGGEVDSEILGYGQSNPALRDGRAGMTDLLGRVVRFWMFWLFCQVRVLVL